MSLRKAGDRRKARARAVDGYLEVAVLLSLIAALPLLIGPGIVNTRSGGDSPFLLMRVQQLAINLQLGIFPVRWMPDAAYGLGYPAFNYYAALPYYLAAAMSRAGLGILWGIKLTQALGFVLAATFTYRLARDLAASRPGALLASTLYTYAPFHLVNVYVRGDSLSEFYAMALYPLAIWSVRRLIHRPTMGRLATVAASYAALILSHNISAVTFSPFLGLWVLVEGLSRQSGRWRALLLATLALGLGLLLSLWFWLPALRESPLVQLGEQTTGYLHFAGHFRGSDSVQWQPLHDYGFAEGGDPFAMGMVQAILAVAGLVALAVRALRRRPLTAPYWLAALALLTYTWLMTPSSRWVWEHMPLLAYAQFPWRMLSVQALAIAILSICIPDAVGGKWRTVSALVLCLAAGIGGMAGLKVDRLPLTEADVTPQRLMLYETYSGNIGASIRHEYLPRDMVPRPYTSGVQLDDGNKPPPLTLSGRLGGAYLEQHSPTSETWEITAIEPSLVAFHTTYYQGWGVTVDGHPQGIEPLPGLGLIGLRIESGNHSVALRLGPTRVRRYATWASLAALLTWAGLLVYPAWRSRRYRVRALRLGSLVVVSAAWLALTPTPTWSTEASGPLVMDFARAPYLHHEPDGVYFSPAHLLDYSLSTDHTTPGATVVLTIAWDAPHPELRLRVRLLGATAHLFRGTPVWVEAQQPLDRAVTETRLALPSTLPPGQYLLRLDVLQAGDKVEIQNVEGVGMEKLVLAPLQITAGTANLESAETLGSYGPPNQPTVIRLVGVEASREKDKVQCTLSWHSERQAPLNYMLSLRLYRTDGSRVVDRDVPPLLGGYPTSLWRPGEQIEDRVILTLPEDEPGTGQYLLQIVLYDRLTLQGVGSCDVPISLP